MHTVHRFGERANRLEITHKVRGFVRIRNRRSKYQARAHPSLNQPRRRDWCPWCKRAQNVSALSRCPWVGHDHHSKGVPHAIYCLDDSSGMMMTRSSLIIRSKTTSSGRRFSRTRWTRHNPGAPSSDTRRCMKHKPARILYGPPYRQLNKSQETGFLPG